MIELLYTTLCESHLGFQEQYHCLDPRHHVCCSGTTFRDRLLCQLCCCRLHEAQSVCWYAGVTTVNIYIGQFLDETPTITHHVLAFAPLWALYLFEDISNKSQDLDYSLRWCVHSFDLCDITLFLPFPS